MFRLKHPYWHSLLGLLLVHATAALAVAEPPAQATAPRSKTTVQRPINKQNPGAVTIHKPDVIFVPTPPEVVEKMLAMAELKKGEVLYDLGCGDGRIVVAAAKRGARAKGFDVDPKRIRESTDNIHKNHVEELASVEQANIFDQDLSGANVITLYLLPRLNVQLIPQLEKLKPGSRIVSHDFDMKGVEPQQVVTVDIPGGRKHYVYLWKAPIKRQQAKR